MKTLKYFLFRFLLSVVLVCTFPLVSQAEFRIGVIISGDVPYYSAMHETFVAEFNKSIPAGEKVEIILQRPFPDPISLSNAARKLIAFDVNLIVTYGSPATHAVVNEKSRIPVVYAGVYDPDSAALTGKNITGCGYKVPLSSLLRYLKRLKRVDTLTILFSGVDEDSVRQAAELLVLTEQQDMKVKKIDIKSRSDLDQLKSINQDDVVFLTGSSLIHMWLKDIMPILRREKVPSADIFPDINEEGVLMTLYQPPDEQGKRAAEMALQIMNGEQLKNIQPRIFRDTELVFNLEEAQGIGITFPIHLIIEATRVIK